MLSKDEANNKTYRYQNNLINCAWLSGFVFNLSEDRSSFYIKQSEFTSGLFLVELDKGDYLPTIYQDGSGIKIYARLIPRLIEGHKSIVLKVLRIEEPSLQELPAIKSADSESTNGYNFYSEFGLEKPSGTPVNNSIVAGFLSNLVFDKNNKGERKTDCLLLDLCVGPDVFLPVRVYGKRCQVQFEQIKKLKNRGKFLPIAFANIKLKTKTIEINADSSESSTILVSYIHSDKITFMNDDLIKEYFLGKPTWLHKLIDAETDK